MKIIETIATIGPSGEIQIIDPQKLPPPGHYKTVLVMDEVCCNAPEPSHRFSGKSFIDVAGDIIGCLDDLPPDLSTNKKYFVGFGE